MGEKVTSYPLHLKEIHVTKTQLSGTLRTKAEKTLKQDR